MRSHTVTFNHSIWLEVASVSLICNVCINTDVLILSLLYIHTVQLLRFGWLMAVMRWNKEARVKDLFTDPQSTLQVLGWSQTRMSLSFHPSDAHWSPILCHWYSLHLKETLESQEQSNNSIHNYKISLRLLVWVYIFVLKIIHTLGEWSNKTENKCINPFDLLF